MSQYISLKGNKYGLSVNIASGAPFESVKAEVAEQFKNAARMFGNDSIAIGFEGRPLSDPEREELVCIIRDSCSLDIVCIMDFNAGTEERFRRAVEKFDVPEVIPEVRLSDMRNPSSGLFEDNISVPDVSEVSDELQAYAREEFFDIAKIAKFYKGNVRNGMVLNEESSLVILGDVNPGGEIYSAGNIIILGSLKGKAFAGTGGNYDCFVFALNMDPMLIQIYDKAGIKSSYDEKNKDEHEPKIAVVKDDTISIELYTRSVLNDINL